jgi:hypothetical protein
MEKIPEFKSESEERVFWEENDSSDYLDWSKADQAVFPNLKPTTRGNQLKNKEKEVLLEEGYKTTAIECLQIDTQLDLMQIEALKSPQDFQICS